jgi:hypothetical protein
VALKIVQPCLQNQPSIPFGILLPILVEDALSANAGSLRLSFARSNKWEI